MAGLHSKSPSTTNLTWLRTCAASARRNDALTRRARAQMKQKNHNALLYFPREYDIVCDAESSKTISNAVGREAHRARGCHLLPMRRAFQQLQLEIHTQTLANGAASLQFKSHLALLHSQSCSSHRLVVPDVRAAHSLKKSNENAVKCAPEKLPSPSV
jgi:hypothetical protein